MEVEIWDGGLQEQEITAIERIKLAFSDKSTKSIDSLQGKSSHGKENGSYTNKNSMFPWKGYAGFRFVDSKKHDGEFDLIIVTHCNLIIVELKDWHHQAITAKGDTWFKGNQNMKRSPVSVTRVNRADA